MREPLCFVLSFPHELHCATSVARPAPPPRDATARLPNELLSDILENLAQPALLRAAAVSRRWRAVAKRLPNYYRYHYMALGEPDDDNIEDLKAVVTDAEESQYNLGLMIDVEDIPDNVSDTDAEMLFSALAPLLRRCVSRLTVLDLNIPARFAAELLDALCTPAPLLRKLTLDFRPEEGSDPATLPGRLFERTAPLLEVVCLCDLALIDPLPLFSSVHTLTIWYDAVVLYLDVLHKCFPAVRHLHLESLVRHVPIPSEEFAIFYQLESLAVGTRTDARVLPSVLLADLYIPKVVVRNARVFASRPDVLSTWLGPGGPVHTVLEYAERDEDDSSDNGPEADSNAEDEPPEQALSLQAELTFLDYGLIRRIDLGKFTRLESFQILSRVRNIGNTTILQIDEVLLPLFISVIGRLPGLAHLKVLLTSPSEWGFCTVLPPHSRLDAPLFPSLRDLELHSTQGPLEITPTALKVLSSAFTPYPDGVLHLWLSGGAYASPDVDVWELFDSVFHDGVEYVRMDRDAWQAWFAEADDGSGALRY